MEFVNLMCAEGLRSLPLNQVQRVRFLNPALENEIRRALNVVSGGHDGLKKSVRLGFRGEGKREVKVGYVVENPIWKSSYRIVMDRNGKAKLLGWANIENTSDEDWHDVRLTLVSGRPISFQMDLYPPLFVPRPMVEPDLFASLRPPTYAGALVGAPTGMQMQGGFTGQPISDAFGGFGGGFGFGGGGFNFNGRGIGEDPPMEGQRGGAVGGLFQGGIAGFGGGTQGQISNLGGQFGFQGPLSPPVNRYQIADNSAASQRLTFQNLQQRRAERQEQDRQDARRIGTVLTNVDPELVESALTVEEHGNPARFAIDEKVSLPRQQSAMIPIFEQPIDVSRVTIYNRQVQAKHPLFGLKIKNTSKQSLMQGPIAVYDDGQYAGDSRILDLQPGEERFISYAIDTGTEIAPFDDVVTSPEMTARVENGRLSVQYKLRSTRTYIIKNRSHAARTVVIEQPPQDGWSFSTARKSVQAAAAVEDDQNVEDGKCWKAGADEKPAERTHDHYRFNLDVKAGETIKYEVSEELVRIDPFQIAKQTDWTNFATTLGLDVMADSKRTPQNSFGMEVAGNELTVTHKDRRTTTYFLRNRADVERTIWLEHFVPRDRSSTSDTKPNGDDKNRLRYKLVIPAGNVATQVVVDELMASRPECFGPTAGEAVAYADTGDLPAKRFITELGFEVWQLCRAQPETVMDAHFVKGDLRTSTREREVATYYIRNLATDPRTFVLDHHVRPEWTFAGDLKPVQGSRTCFRTTIGVGPGAIAKQEIVEERLVVRTETLDSLSKERLKTLFDSSGIAIDVKENLRRGKSMLDELKLTEGALVELQAQLKAIVDEQARLKGNLTTLLPSSDVYKRLTDKFDKQETALEAVQKQIAETTTLQKSQRRDLTSFIGRLGRATPK
jgi:hypothetical protein